LDAHFSQEFLFLHSQGGFTLQHRWFDQPRHATLFLSPGHFCHSLSYGTGKGHVAPKLVLNVLGNSKEAFSQMVKWVPTYSAALIPDYVVVDTQQVKQRGIAGLLAAGYWNHEWKVASETGFIKDT
jgi:hypothetical protein